MQTRIRKLEKEEKLFLGELEGYRQLITTIYPKGFVSLVSDTYDLWQVLTKFLPILKDDIMARDGKVVIRPDSGNPVDIICGSLNIGHVGDLTKWFKGENPLDDPQFFWDSLQEDSQADVAHGEMGPDTYTETYKVKDKYYNVTVHNLQYNRYDKQYYFLDMYDKPKITVQEIIKTPAQKGVIELLWDVFGGTVNEQGYKVLDSHIGAIYGDSINLQRAKEIAERLKAKGFASQCVLGIGSFTYQYNTRDTFGMAVKATYIEKTVDGKTEGFNIFKDPITDDGTKKSLTGLLRVKMTDGKFAVVDNQTIAGEEASLMETVFEDGKLVKEQSLTEIRNWLKQQNG